MKVPDIERGSMTASKVYINGDEESSEPQPRKTDPSKKRKWITHVLVILLSCALSAGAGFIVFVAQRAPQMVTFQTQFDRSPHNL